MDTLEWDLDDTDPDRNRIKVKYQNFETSIEGQEADRIDPTVLKFSCRCDLAMALDRNLYP